MRLCHLPIVIRLAFAGLFLTRCGAAGLAHAADLRSPSTVLADSLAALQPGWTVHVLEDSLRARDSRRAPERKSTASTASAPSGSGATWDSLTVLRVPGEMYGAKSVYDARRNRVLLFSSLANSQGNLDTWELNRTGSAEWQALSVGTLAPPARIDFTAVYDSVGDRVVLFAGYSFTGVYLNDVWVLHLAYPERWEQLTPVGPLPPPRLRQVAVWDSDSQRMVIQGGFFSDGSQAKAYSDTWSLSLEDSPAWTQLLPSGPIPTARMDHVAGFDPVRHRMLMYGGRAASSYPEYADTWELSLGDAPAWRQLGLSSTHPAAHWGLAGAVDAAGGRFLVFGGSGNFVCSSDLWGLTLDDSTQWSRITTSSPPPPRYSTCLAVTPVLDDAILFGGGCYGPTNETWTLNLFTNAWSPTMPVTTGRVPTSRHDYAAAMDDAQQRMLMFGGAPCNDHTCYSNDTWELRLGDTSPAWHLFTPTSAYPGVRWGAAVAYDPVRFRLFIYGGEYSVPYGPSDHKYVTYDDLWAFHCRPDSSAYWEKITPSGARPGPRESATFTYDPIGDRLVLFGGEGYGYPLSNETWTLSLNGAVSWQNITATVGLPPSRSQHTAVYDPLLQRMLVFGGIQYGLTTYGSNDVWSLPLGGGTVGAWQQLDPGGGPCPTRARHGAVFDPIAGEMLVYAGETSRAVTLGDLWGYSSGAGWEPLLPAGLSPGARQQCMPVYDAGKSRMLLWSGIASTVGPLYGDLWELQRPGATPVSGARGEAVCGDVAGAHIRWTWHGAHPTQVSVLYAASPDASWAALGEARVSATGVLDWPIVAAGRYAVRDQDGAESVEAEVVAACGLPRRSDARVATLLAWHGSVHWRSTAASAAAPLELFTLAGRRVATWPGASTDRVAEQSRTLAVPATVPAGLYLARQGDLRARVLVLR